MKVFKEAFKTHKPGKEYILVNRDKSEVECEIVYYPLPYYDDDRACIDLGNNDIREVPVRFLFSKEKFLKYVIKNNGKVELVKKGAESK